MALFLAAAAGIAYLLLATPIYTSEARIRYPQLTPRVADGGAAAMVDTQSFLNTEAEVIASTAVLLVALSHPDMEQIDLLQADPNPIRALKNGLDVSIGRHNDLITIAYSSPNRFDAQTVVASVVNAYQTFQAKERQDALDAMDRERQKILEELADRNRELVAFKKEHGQLAFDEDENNPVLQRLGSLADALTAAHLESVNAKSAYEDAVAAIAGDSELQRRLGGLTNDGARLNVVNEQMLQNELFNLQQRLEEAKRQYGTNHPLVNSIQGRVDHLTVAFVGVARDRWLAAERRQTELEKHFDQLQEQAAALHATRAQYEQVRREADRLDRLADEVATRIRGMSVVEGSGALNITVLDAPTLPDLPSAPRKAKVITVALAGGMFVGLGLALLVDWRDQRLHTVDDVKRTLGVPVMGVVPAMPAGIAPNIRGLTTHLEPASPIATAFAAVRTNVYFGLPDSARTILVTSPQPGDGKSTLVSNLAIAMAQAGRRVLIIDANCRLPVQHKMFALPAGSGLTGVLSDRVTLDKAILPSGIDDLDLLPCGTLPPNPSELFNSQDFSDLLGDLATRYDYILLDAPSLTTAADARIISAWCDATLLVLHADRTDRRLAQIARDGLIAVGANLAGVIVNDADPQSRKHAFLIDVDLAGGQTHSETAQPMASQNVPSAAAPYLSATASPSSAAPVEPEPARPEADLPSSVTHEVPVTSEPDVEPDIQPQIHFNSAPPAQSGSQLQHEDDEDPDWNHESTPPEQASDVKTGSDSDSTVSQEVAAGIDADADQPKPVDQSDESAEDEPSPADADKAADKPQDQSLGALRPLRESRNIVTGLTPEKLAETSAELRRKFEALR